MVAAVGRIQGQAGALGGQVKGLARDSASLVDELKRVDSTARAAAETLQRYRREVAGGKTLAERDLGDIPGLKEVIVSRGGPAGQAFVSQFERELGGGPPPSPRRPTVPSPQAPRQVVQPPEHGPRDLTADERAEYLKSGRYTAEQLQRARMLKPGTIMIPGPALKPTGDVATPEADQSVQTPEHTAQRAEDTEQPRAAERRARAVDRDAEALYRHDQRKRAQILTERQLRHEWNETTRSLRQQERELDTVDTTMRRLQRDQDRGLRLSGRQSFALEEDLPARRSDLHAGARQLRLQRDALREEAANRGYSVMGDRLVAPERAAGPVQQGFGAFMGGMGVGSGNIGGTIAGAVTGVLSPVNAGLALAGLLLGKLADLGKQAYETEMRYLAATLPMARMTGMSAHELMRAGVGEADQFKVFELNDLFQSRAAMLRGTGHGETATSVLPVAALTGQTASEEAQRIVALSRMSARFNPGLSSDLLRAYGSSAIARPRIAARPMPLSLTGPQPPPDRSLPFETALYPEFAQQVGRVAQHTTSPFTRVSVGGIAAQLGAATRLSIPGLDMSSTGGLDVATNLLQGLNQLTGRSTDAFGDMGMLGVLRLRGTPAAQRLKETYGIDLSTMIGVMRAQSRAPELASHGFPEVQRAILESQRQFMPDDDMRAMGLVMHRGMDPEAAFQLTRPGVDRIASAAADTKRGRGPGPWRTTDADIDAAAASLGGRPDVGQFYEWNIRPETMMLQASLDLTDRLGAAITQGMNDLRDAVRQQLTEFFNSPGVAMVPADAPASLGLYGGEAAVIPYAR